MRLFCTDKDARMTDRNPSRKPLNASRVRLGLSSLNNDRFPQIPKATCIGLVSD